MAITEGLLAVGGDLSIERLVQAYRPGNFPPGTRKTIRSFGGHRTPRLVLYPEAIHVSRSLRKLMRRKPFYRYDRHGLRPRYTGLRREAAGRTIPGPGSCRR